MNSNPLALLGTPRAEQLSAAVGSDAIASCVRVRTFLLKYRPDALGRAIYLPSECIRSVAQFGLLSTALQGHIGYLRVVAKQGCSDRMHAEFE